MKHFDVKFYKLYDMKTECVLIPSVSVWAVRNRGYFERGKHTEEHTTGFTCYFGFLFLKLHYLMRVRYMNKWFYEDDLPF